MVTLNQKLVFDDAQGLSLDQLRSAVPFANESGLQKLYQAANLAYQIENEAKQQDDLWGSGLGAFSVGLDMVNHLVELQADVTALIAAMLYRCVREDRLSLPKVQKQFGKEVADLVASVSRMAVISYINEHDDSVMLGQSISQMDNLRRMIVEMMDDVRVALIKLCERKAILEGLKDADEARKVKIAREVMEIYAPLAHRLGVGQVKWELEDLAFRYIQPEIYKGIAKQLDEKRIEREDYIETTVQTLNDTLGEAGISAQVSGRVKHIYSIWRKMQKKRKSFEEIYDIRALRVLVNNVADCYSVLGKVHSLWEPVPGEFDDYIAKPKSNGYQSLHTALFGPSGKIIEVQIRTQQMHQDAELGVCAHWRYKEVDGSNDQARSAYEQKLEWLRHVIEWQEEIGGSDAQEELRAELNAIKADRIFVITPKGHVVDVPYGATPVDFAYYIHTEVGHHCRGAKVNGRIVPLTHTLQTGDQVEVLTTKEGGPSRDWLNRDAGYVTSAQARGRIRAWFRELEREENIQAGKSLLDKEIRRLSLRKLDLEQVLPKLQAQTVEEMYMLIGTGDLRVSHVISLSQQLLLDELDNEFDGDEQETLQLRQASDSSEQTAEITVEGESGMLIKLAACCSPVPGESILGYITRGAGVSVHREDCVNLQHLQQTQPKRIIEVSWGHHQNVTYPVRIFIKAQDKEGLLNEIVGVLSSTPVNVTACQTQSHRADKTASLWITFEIPNIDSLSRIFSRLEQLPFVLDAHRINLKDG